jgi:hypothetical protein
MTDALLFAGASQIFNFEIIQNLTFRVTKSGIEDMAIPGFINPITFDSKCMERIITFDWVIIPTTYSTGNGAGGNGSGSILDQIDDLDYYARSQSDVLTSAGASFYTFACEYPGIFNASHTPKDSFGGVAQGDATKNHYVYFTSINFPRVEGTPGLVIARVEMKEVDILYGL